MMDQSAIHPHGPQLFGRYELSLPIGEGGMGAVHLGRLVGGGGFTRLVAVKRVHPSLRENAGLVEMLVKEIETVSAVQHPTVVPVLDVVEAGGELAIVEEFVHGVSLAALMEAARKSGEAMPVDVLVAVAAEALAGLHAAHEAKDATGNALDLVHGDISPRSVMVGLHGETRLLGFGLAKVLTRARVTTRTAFKGKVGHVAPEQLRGVAPQRTADIYSLGIVLWEGLIGRRLRNPADPNLVTDAVAGRVPMLTQATSRARTPVSEQRLLQLQALEPIVARAVASDPAQRFETAAEMLEAMCAAVQPALQPAVARWVASVATADLTTSAASVRVALGTTTSHHPPTQDAAVEKTRISAKGPNRSVRALARFIRNATLAFLATVALLISILFLALGPRLVISPSNAAAHVLLFHRH